ncbi:RICIN domain-containing protein [Streptomyces griseoluteus]|uniref:RICIN domain-containing protein n=1 Tax=Streptomyces griseoluteus TaxID=29306 RepID=UPI00382FE00B
MANTQALREETRPSGTNVLFVAWETLTNAENPVMPNTQLPKGPITGLGDTCMDVPGAAADGTKVQLFDRNGTDAQVWQKGAGDTLVNKTSGKCLDVTDMSPADAARLQIWTCTGDPNQHFHAAA